MKVFKLLVVSLVLGFLFSSNGFAAGNYFINSTSQGQYTDINAVNACGSSARSGLKAVIDVACAKQTSTSATTAAQTVIQNSTADGANAAGFSGLPPAVAFTCTQDTTGRSTCSDYTTTTSSKVGAIGITVNGTVLFLRTYNSPS